MRNIILLPLVCLAACSSPQDQPPVAITVKGTLQQYKAFPSNLIPPRQVDIWLPENYDSTKKYQVLYMHDGQMLFDSTTTWNHQEWGVDETISQLVGAEIIAPTIVVGIWNNGPHRHPEYFPQKAFETLPKSFQDSLLNNQNRPKGEDLYPTPISSDNYLRFLVEELKPFVDQAYPTLSDPAHTFIAGSSMGGLISMYALCEYPNIFGGAACLSTHWTGTFTTENNPIPAAFINYLNDNLPAPGKNRIYFDYGTETLDALYEPYQLQVDQLMEASGFDASNWMTKKFEGHDHSEKSWNQRLYIPITFLMGR